ncbi:type II toxin-antitoxin system RelE/ParE family toxin [Flagellimonas algicola]|uniref:Type II toxin-antitoxin system RelE/ParE family toxin n=1 Tax=Flagellimonas algicola TaxID=2583815 RepID=A0ABY2WJ41_9FLAO|nr:type II toxin-antitoxin system RelE/ParE family toxin [Allomuricauda algicola]TMU54851.1 type II toxin-antitoxin system RelE/ParE family toxin [Allomuricauda algicola]
MTSGYKILWSNHALSELKQTLNYLETKWTVKELRAFSSKLDHVITLISKDPNLFPVASTKKLIHRAVVDKNNTLYYCVEKEVVQIVSLFSTRQDPDKKRI